MPPIPGFNYNGGTLKSFTFANAPSSYARGVELNFDHRFHELPGLLGGLGLSANFTYVDLRFEIRPGEFSNLPSTSKYTYNAAVFYEQGTVALRLAAYSASDVLFGIGGDKTTDIYNAARTSMDFGASYKLGKHWTSYFNAKKFTQYPARFLSGHARSPDPARILQPIVPARAPVKYLIRVTCSTARCAITRASRATASVRSKSRATKPVPASRLDASPTVKR